MELKRKITIISFCLAGLVLSSSGCSLLPAANTAAEASPPAAVTLQVEATMTSPPAPTSAPTGTATVTPVVVSATNTPQPALTLAIEGAAFTLAGGSPVYTVNFAHPEAGCGWLGLAGQVFDAQAVPLPNLLVVVEGYLGETPVEGLALTGSSPAYGPGGYEIVLGSLPVESSKALTVSLFDLEGNLLASRVALDTYADCGKNLILVNFEAVR